MIIIEDGLHRRRQGRSRCTTSSGRAICIEIATARSDLREFLKTRRRRRDRGRRVSRAHHLHAQRRGARQADPRSGDARVSSCRVSAKSTKALEDAYFAEVGAGRMNPEFQRNLWLELTPRRMHPDGRRCWRCVFFAAALAGGRSAARRLRRAALYLSSSSWSGARATRRCSVVGEIRDRTWDGQRLSSLGARQMTWGKLFGSTIYQLVRRRDLPCRDRGGRFVASRRRSAR